MNWLQKGESLTGHVLTHANPADLCTKVLPGGQKHDGLVSLVIGIWWIYWKQTINDTRYAPSMRGAIYEYKSLNICILQT